MIEHVKKGFEVGVFGSKITLIVLLLALSFINADISFIKDKPRMFVLESVVVGLSAAVPFTYIAMNRGRQLGDAISLGLTAFLVFFLFHIVMEFSGQNQAMVDKSQLTESERKQQAFVDKVSKLKATKLIIFAIVLMVIIMSLIVRDFGPGVKVVTNEAFLMAICGALPTIMIAINRDERDVKEIVKEFALYFGVFFAGHYTLQLGGFYSNLLP
jgi:hypothetical protein